MERERSQFWFKAAMIAAAILLPFGTVILIAVAAARARRARRLQQPHAEWWRLRDLARSASSPSAPNGRHAPEGGTVLRPEFDRHHRSETQ